MIRFTFYTESDDFSYRQSVDDAREWLRSRGFLHSVLESPEGSMSRGSALEDLSDSDVGRWVASASMGIVRKKADVGGYISFFTERGDEWVSVFADRIQAIGSSIEADDEADDDDAEPDGPQWTSWTEEEPRFTD